MISRLFFSYQESHFNCTFQWFSNLLNFWTLNTCLSRNVFLSSIPTYSQLLFQFCQFENTLKAIFSNTRTFTFKWVGLIILQYDMDLQTGIKKLNINSHNSTKIWTSKRFWMQAPQIPCLGVGTQCLSHKSCYNKQGPSCTSFVPALKKRTLVLNHWILCCDWLIWIWAKQNSYSWFLYEPGNKSTYFQLYPDIWGQGRTIFIRNLEINTLSGFFFFFRKYSLLLMRYQCTTFLSQHCFKKNRRIFVNYRWRFCFVLFHYIALKIVLGSWIKKKLNHVVT